jgi:hypothetical protein
LSRLSPTPHTASRRSICKRRRFLQLKQHKTAASAAPGNSGLELRRRAAVVAEVFTVSVVETGTRSSVLTLAGEKLHDAPEGSPEQLNETVATSPFNGVTVTVVVPLCPAVTVIEAGEAATVKSGVSLMVYNALAMTLGE